MGTTGIPLEDELKSLALTDDEGIVIAHCRGDQEIHLERLGEVHGGPGLLAATAASDLAELGLGYGLINPFETWVGEVSVRHVFDSDLLTRSGLPGTMMTNAGDATWAVEFYTDELIAAYRSRGSATIADGLAIGGPARAPSTNRSIGILTGNGPESGAALLQRVIDNARRPDRLNLGDLTLPPVQMLSLPAMGLSMEMDLRVDAVRRAVIDGVGTLARSGCAHIALACNTTQYFVDELRPIAAADGAEVVSMAEAVSEHVARLPSVDSVGLFGIELVTSETGWSAYRRELAERNISVEVPSSYGLERLDAIAYAVKREGVTPRNVTHLTNVIRDVAAEEFDSTHVIVALTELSILLADVSKKALDRHGQVFIDPLDIAAEQLVFAVR
ncbi:MAG: aspartate/glutamate racemase family protein [Actinomycetota bacterium]